ncbi:hypothetical protein M404DRAFT_936262 [Pisolithus tinctorius Marx 270]|uniref:Uncharacterized protein n=1 Tax=Pisolithus tinctorius Marx 270 TaxID=870435 RepID=A0A0C3P6F9_PISTI|nr:hypothetical protein M404DRAFT_936262 [Pisolithus tinctorius Marx 270]
MLGREAATTTPRADTGKWVPLPQLRLPEVRPSEDSSPAERFSESKSRLGEDEEGPGTAIRHGGDTIGGLWVLEIGLEVEGVIGEGSINEVGARVASLLGGEEVSFRHWVRLKLEWLLSLSAKAEGSLIAGMGIPDVIVIGTNWGTRSDAAGVEEQK